MGLVFFYCIVLERSQSTLHLSIVVGIPYFYQKISIFQCFWCLCSIHSTSLSRCSLQPSSEVSFPHDTCISQESVIFRLSFAECCCSDPCSSVGPQMVSDFLPVPLAILSVLICLALGEHSHTLDADPGLSLYCSDLNKVAALFLCLFTAWASIPKVTTSLHKACLNLNIQCGKQPNLSHWISG